MLTHKPILAHWNLEDLWLINWFFIGKKQIRILQPKTINLQSHKCFHQIWLIVWPKDKVLIPSRIIAKNNSLRFTELHRQRFGIREKQGKADRKVPSQPNVFYGNDGKVSRWKEMDKILLITIMIFYKLCWSPYFIFFMCII